MFELVYFSVLHIAARRQDWKMMSCLIQLGANPLQENVSFRTSLQMIALKVMPSSFPYPACLSLHFMFLPFLTEFSCPALSRGYC